MSLTGLGMFVVIMGYKGHGTKLRTDYNVITAPLVFDEHLTNLSGVMNHRRKGKNVPNSCHFPKGLASRYHW